MCVSFILAPFCPSVSLPFHRVFFIHVCPCRWCTVCTREATAAPGQFLPHSGHCCSCWWFNQLQKKPPSQQWQLGPASLCLYFKRNPFLFSINNLWYISTFGGGSCSTLLLVPQKPVAKINLPLTQRLWVTTWFCLLVCYGIVLLHLHKKAFYRVTICFCLPTLSRIEQLLLEVTDDSCNISCNRNSFFGAASASP